MMPITQICAAALATLLLACQPSVTPAPSQPVPTTSSFGNPQPVTIQGYEGFADEPFISRDGQLLFWNDQRTIYYAQRINDTTFQYLGPVHGFPPAVYNGVPSMDAAGNFYWLSTISPRRDRMTLYRGTFKDGAVSGGTPVHGIAGDQPGMMAMDAEISSDGVTLYHTSEPPVTFEIATRDPAGTFTKAPNSANILASIMTAGQHVYAPDISADGLELYYSSMLPEGGIHVVRRNTTAEPFGPPQFIVGGNSEAPSISPDGKHLYYGHAETPGAMRIWVMTRQ